MHFTTPLALLLLLTLPIFAWLGWPSRGYGQARERLSLGIRLTIALLLIFAIAGLAFQKESDNLAVVFLVDNSDSMPDASRIRSIDYIENALLEMGTEDQAGVILFGGDALIERSMSTSKELGTFFSAPNTNQTDIAGAIRLAMAMFPPDYARRIVILSDGAATTGDAISAAQLALASGVETLVVPMQTESGAEVTLTAVDTPQRLLENEQFDIRLTINSEVRTNAGVRVLANGQVVYQGDVDLERGPQSYSLPLSAGAPGFVRYQVQIIPVEDNYFQNNELASFSQVSGPPKILVVAPPEGEQLPRVDQTRPDEYSTLVNALTASGFNIDTVRPSGLPSELALLSDYGAVVLVDVPARDLTNRQMRAVQSYVRDLGGGLLTVGGPTSYGVGGYFQTPLEETLPIEMQIKDEERRPTLTMVFIIDRSGSMSDSSSGTSKLELAKEAAARSVELLFPSDRVGVIAFDSSGTWVVEIIDLVDPGYVIEQIGTLRSGGGTDILAGLQTMAAVLPDDPSSVKHVVLLTDGGANPAGIPELAEKLFTENGITISSVAIGTGAAPFLEEIALRGGGRYHYTENAESIPSIFTEETTLATRSYIVEESFFPKQAAPSQILSGISDVPPLHGYVGATTKTTAQSVLVTDRGDPILASWQYGLGKAIAFTSDASPRWARDWVPWEGFPIIWGQMVRFVLNENMESGLSVAISQNEGLGKIVVDAQNRDGLYLNNYEMKANLISPDGAVTEVILPQTAPGRYEGEFTPDEQGVYLVRVDGSLSEGTDPLNETTGWVLSYSPEYLPQQEGSSSSNIDILYDIAALEGGRITTGNPREAFEHTLTIPQASTPIWPILLTIAVILLPFDVGVRRLVFSWRDVQRSIHRLQNRISVIRTSVASAEKQPVHSPKRSQSMETLLRAKERTRDETKITTIEISKDIVETETVRLTDQLKIRPKSEDVVVSEEVRSRLGEKEKKDEKRTPKISEEGDNGSTTSVLLKRKRERQKRREE